MSSPRFSPDRRLIILALSYSRYEAYDRVEGQAAIAKKTALLKSENDEELSSSDKKEIEKEKTHQLNMRHRGVMQYKAAR